MRNPIIVLECLSKSKTTVFNLYHNLYNPEFYKIAYQNLYSKPSQMTLASDGSTIDGMSEERINKLIQKLRDGTYKPTNLRRVNIPKKSGGTRKISVPSFDDKLIQEIIRMILEAIYEHTFLNCSHGFRPGRSCHSALKYLQLKGTGTKWWIDADIKGCFDNINHKILLKILSERIKEQKFLILINKFLKAGYLENWQYHKTYSGVPQGSIIGPILSNIYLDKFDKFMEDLIRQFRKGKSRKPTTEYTKYRARTYRAKKKIKEGNKSQEAKNQYLLAKKELRKFTMEHGNADYYDPEFRRLSYVRYADDFVIGIISSRKEALEIKESIKKFLKEELDLCLNEEKTKIVNNQKKIIFLGYEVTVMRSKDRPSINGDISLLLPYDRVIDLIRNNNFGTFVRDGQTGKQKLCSLHNPSLVSEDDLEILKIYDTKIRGFYNYYRMASNVCKLSSFYYIIQDSFIRTLANKYKTSRAKIYANRKYNQRFREATHVGITYKRKFHQLFHGPFIVKKYRKVESDIDIIENIMKYKGRNSLIKRLEAHKCEWCGNTDGPFEVHHIKALKDLKGKECWKIHMAARRRKTMVLCRECHKKLHSGKLNNKHHK